MNFKKILSVVTVLLAVVAYPLVSSSKSDTKNTITLTDKNLVVLNGAIDDESVGSIIQQLQKLDQQTKLVGKPDPIYLYLYTPGGSIQSGLELIDATQGLNRPVNTVISFAASMGWQTAQGLGERLILKNGVLMSHRAAGGFEGSFGGKGPSQLDNRYAFWLQRLNEMDEQTVRRSKGKQTLESYRNQYQNEMWLTGSQAVEQGYADQVVAVKCDKSLDGNITHSVNFLGFLITYETARCPIVTAIMNVKISAPGENGNVKVARVVEEEIKNKFLNSLDIEKNIR